MGRYLIYLLALQIVEWLKYRIPRQQPIKICQTVVSEISLALASGCMSTKDIITHVSRIKYTLLGVYFSGCLLSSALAV